MGSICAANVATFVIDLSEAIAFIRATGADGCWVHAGRLASWQEFLLWESCGDVELASDAAVRSGDSHAKVEA